MDQTINTHPLVSVLMPVYNAEKHLREAMDSIINQTYKNIEFIVINDGSTDRSLEIIKSYNDARLVLISNDVNRGLIYSLNYGIGQCKGKYIARMDADDISLPERIAEQVKFMEMHEDVGVCGCDYIQFSKTSEKKYKALTNHDEILSHMMFNSAVIHPSLTIRKSMLERFNPVFNAGYNHSEDYELWSKLIFECKFSAVSKLLFKYRIHASQVTNVHSNVQTNSADKVRKELLDKLGFVYSQKDYELLCQLAGPNLFNTKQDILSWESFLFRLIEQNEQTKNIDPVEFNKVISFKWYSACGYTTLGLWAFFRYYKSPLKNYKPRRPLKLLAKCMVRYLRKTA